MTKQLLIYESARPISAAHHGKMSVEAVADYSFSAGINAVPLMGLEFIRAATEYANSYARIGPCAIERAASSAFPRLR